MWPKHKATNDYTMLQALPCQQYWVSTKDNATPGDPDGWEVETVYSEEEKP